MEEVNYMTHLSLEPCVAKQATISVLKKTLRLHPAWQLLWIESYGSLKTIIQEYYKWKCQWKILAVQY